MELSEIIAELGKHPKDAVANALQTTAQPIFQVIFDKGHATATAAANAKETQLSGQIATLTKERDEAVKRATASGGEDVATVRQQYDSQIQKLQNDHAAELTKLKSVNVTAEKRRARAQVEAGLVAKGVNRKLAKVMAADPDLEQRLELTEKDGATSLTVLQAGKKIPLSVADGVDPIGVLVDEMFGTVEPEFLTSTGDRGAGEESRGGAGGGGTKGKLADYRKKVEAEREAKKPTDTRTAAERLGQKQRA